MANVIKKHSISSELAQKMVDAAVAKAKAIGVSENVTILDDGGNLTLTRFTDTQENKAAPVTGFQWVASASRRSLPTRSCSSHRTKPRSSRVTSSMSTAVTARTNLFGRPRLRKGADYYDPYPINAQYISNGRRKSSG
jgi:uncharacterized protein GlcG (DUF336 family)